MDWFEKEFGFKETIENIKKNISVENNKIISLANKRKFQMGFLEVPSIAELRENVNKKRGNIKISEVYGNVVKYHEDPNNANAFFQVASQFNLLEMIRPENTPEHGITIYEGDPTQGPACAMTCAAGTLYRNYFTKVNTLSEVEKILSKDYWIMKNGYTMFNKKNIKSFSKEVEDKIEEIKGAIKVGIQWKTEVMGTNHNVSQIYCSAVPISYNEIRKIDLEVFARTVLEAAYEATFIASINNRLSNKLFLTLLGGGAFGNKREWIFTAIRNNLMKYKNYNIDISFVTYSGIPDRDIQDLMSEFNK